jgi:hypothetical protein
MSTTSPDPLKFRLTHRTATSPPLQYFEDRSIEFEVVNISSEVLLLEAVQLKFEADTGAVPNYVDASPGLRLPPNESGMIKIDVRPLPLYKEYTNQFDALLRFRPETHGRLGKLSTERHDGFYIIINTPAATLGDVFVSFKQPEDQRLANILERYTKRAGFTPHLFMRNPAVGADQWKSIEKLIKQSHSMFVVWGRRTEWGEGVGKEIELCRRRRMREIPLVEEGLVLPDAYQNTNCTYKRYDPEDPAHVLSETVSSLRVQVLASQRSRHNRA